MIFEKIKTVNTKNIIKHLAIFAIFISFGTYSKEETKKVIIVSSYHQEFEAKRNMLQTLRDNLTDAKNVQIITLYLNSKRTSEHRVTVKANKILQRINETSADVIFLADDNAVAYLAEKLLAQSFNVVVLGVNENPRHYVNDSMFSNLQGVLERPLYLRSILQLKPFYSSSTKVTILMDDTVTSKVIYSKLFGNSNSISRGGITVRFKKVKDFQSLMSFVEMINNDVDHELFVITLFNIIDNDTGNVLATDYLLGWLREHYKKPIYSFWKTNVKDHFFLAAYGSSNEAQGLNAARIGNDIILGNNHIKGFITPREGIFFISDKLLEKYNINVPEKIKLKTFISYK